MFMLLRINRVALLWALLGSVCLTLILPAELSAAPYRIVVDYEGQDPTAEACAQALVNTPIHLGEDIEGKVESFPLGPRRTTASDYGKASLVVSVGIDEAEEIPPFDIPFAFRDAAHFQSFVASSLFRDLQLTWDAIMPSYKVLLGYAYGGFGQLFTADKRISDIGSLKGLIIDSVLPRSLPSFKLYSKVGAEADKSSVLFDLRTVAAIANIGRQLRASRKPKAVRALLTHALAAGLDKSARYVSLVSEELFPVYIVATTSGKVSSGMKAGLRQWAEAAARACSSKNFMLEQQALERLRKSGVSVDNFDRAPLIGLGWQEALLDHSFRYWTLRDLDKLEQMAAAPQISVMPSEILARLDRTSKRKATNYDWVATGRRERLLLRLGLPGALKDSPEDVRALEKSIGLRLSSSRDEERDGVVVLGHGPDASDAAKSCPANSRIESPRTKKMQQEAREAFEVEGGYFWTTTVHFLRAAVDELRREGNRIATFTCRSPPNQPNGKEIEIPLQ
jgi:hypothetical protein